MHDLSIGKVLDRSVDSSSSVDSYHWAFNRGRDIKYQELSFGISIAYCVYICAKST